MHSSHAVLPDKVAIIIPVYNRASKILEALDSIAYQTRAPDILIVIDDGSTDDTYTTVKAWRDREHRSFEIRILQQENQGAGAARNTGFREVADHEFVAFLDSDDLWPPEFLEKSLTALQRDPAAMVAVADRMLINEDEPSFSGTRELIDAPILWLFRNGAGILSCTLIRSAAITAVGGFDHRLMIGEDLDLFVRISLLGHWIHVDMRPVIFHRNMGKIVPGRQNQSLILDNHAEQSAAIRESLFIQLRNLPNISSSHAEFSKLMARSWYKAGLHALMNRANPGKALTCFKHSIAWGKSEVRIGWHYLACKTTALWVKPQIAWEPPPLRPLDFVWSGTTDRIK